MLETAPSTYSEQTFDSESRRLVLPPEVQEAIRYKQGYAYETLKADFGIEAPDIPRDDINTYFTRLGLTPPPLIVLNVTPEAIARIAPLDPSAAMSLQKPTIVGTYGAAINVAFIANNQLRQSDDIHKASAAVHESAHGTSSTTYEVTEHTAKGFIYRVAKSGYGGGGRNVLPDEGRAELLAAHFIYEEYPHKKFEPSDRYGIAIPGTYVFDNDKVVNATAPAAIALELLIAKDPELLGAIIKDPTSEDYPHETAKRLNSIQAGLYDRLGSVPYGYEAFEAATKSIIDELYNGDTYAPNEVHHHVARLIKGM